MVDAFSSATLDMYLEFPFFRGPDRRSLPKDLTLVLDVKRLTGCMKNGVFCVPANPELSSPREHIDDRLYNIRNFQDISGKLKLGMC